MENLHMKVGKKSKKKDLKKNFVTDITKFQDFSSKKIRKFSKTEINL